MVDIRKSTHRHHTRCIHSNTLVLLSLRLYRYRFVLFNKIRVHRTLLFVSLLGQKHESVKCPRPSVHQPARQPAIQSQSLESAPVTRKISPPAIQSQSLKSERVIQKTAHARASVARGLRAACVQRARQSLDGAIEGCASGCARNRMKM